MEERLILPSWCQLNNSETLKTVTPTFCSIQYISLVTSTPNFVSLTCPSLEILGKSQGIYDFPISGQSFIKENCHNSRTRNDIDMKLGPVTKLDKRNTRTLKKLTIAPCRQLWRYCHFSNLWLIWSNLEPGFRTHFL